MGAALKLIEPGRGDFLLESVEGGEVRGRYSMLGLDPDLVFRAEGAEAGINARWQADRERFEDLPGNASRVGAYMQDKLQELSHYAHVGEVRGKGAQGCNPCDGQPW